MTKPKGRPRVYENTDSAKETTVLYRLAPKIKTQLRILAAKEAKSLALLSSEIVTEYVMNNYKEKS